MLASKNECGPVGRLVSIGCALLNQADHHAEIQEQLGIQLRELYTDVLDQPLPERFRELLNRLDNSRLVQADAMSERRF